MRLAGIPSHGLGQARVFIGEQVGLLSVPWLGPGDMQGLRVWRAVGMIVSAVTVLVR